MNWEQYVPTSPGRNRSRRKLRPHAGWLRNPFAPRNETMVETIRFVGICVGESNQQPGFLHGAKRISQPGTSTRIHGDIRTEAKGLTEIEH